MCLLPLLLRQEAEAVEELVLMLKMPTYSTHSVRVRFQSSISTQELDPAFVLVLTTRQTLPPVALTLVVLRLVLVVGQVLGQVQHFVVLAEHEV